jgi:hypothetical protein
MTHLNPLIPESLNAWTSPSAHSAPSAVQSARPSRAKKFAPKPESKHHCNAGRYQKRGIPGAAPPKIEVPSRKSPLQFGFGTNVNRTSSGSIANGENYEKVRSHRTRRRVQPETTVWSLDALGNWAGDASGGKKGEKGDITDYAQRCIVSAEFANKPTADGGQRTARFLAHPPCYPIGQNDRGSAAFSGRGAPGKGSNLLTRPPQERRTMTSLNP